MTMDREMLDWQGVLAMPGPTVDGRILTVTGHADLPLPLFGWTPEGQIIVGRIDDIRVEAGQPVTASGRLDGEALPSIYREMFDGPDGLPVAVAVVATAAPDYEPERLRVTGDIRSATVSARVLAAWPEAVIRPVRYSDAPAVAGEHPEPEPGREQPTDAAGYACWRAWVAACAAPAAYADTLTVANYSAWRGLPTPERNRWVRFAAQFAAAHGDDFLQALR